MDKDRNTSRLNTWGLEIDLVDACNLACRTCPRGLRAMKNIAGQMPIEMFRKIIQKASKLNCIKAIDLFNWTEPFLCHNLEKYTKIVKKYGFYCGLSSNLSFKKINNIIEVLKNVDNLIVSLSGYSQTIYKINHYGGNIEHVKNNLKIIAEAKSQGLINTKVKIRYFNFDYAINEYRLFEEFAQKYELPIELFNADGCPKNICRKVRQPYTSGPIFNQIVDLSPCHLHNRFALDMRGDVYVCCAVVANKKTKVGNFLRDDFDILEYKRITHPFCAICSWKIPEFLHKDSLERFVTGAVKQLKNL